MGSMSFSGESYNSQSTPKLVIYCQSECNVSITERKL